MSDPRYINPAEQRKAELDAATKLVTRGYITPTRTTQAAAIRLSQPATTRAGQTVIGSIPVEGAAAAKIPAAKMNPTGMLGSHEGGHKVAVPAPGSDGSGALATLEALRRELAGEPDPLSMRQPTAAEVKLAQQAAANGDLVMRAWLHGLGRGSAVARIMQSLRRGRRAK